MYFSGEDLVIHGASDYEVVGVLKSDPPTVLIRIFPGDKIRVPISEIKPSYATSFYVSCGDVTVYYEDTDIYTLLEEARDR